MASRPESTLQINEDGKTRVFRWVRWVTTEDLTDMIVEAQAGVVFHGTRYVPGMMSRAAKEQLLKVRLPVRGT